MGEAMSDDGLLHTTELLRTALPYVDIKSRLTLDLLIKLYELIICMRNFTNKDMTACNFENESADMEALLKSIRPKCDKNEQTYVDKMLNIFQAKRIFEMYNTYMETMNTMQGFEGFAGGGVDNDTNDDTFNGFMNSYKDFDFSSFLDAGHDGDTSQDDINPQATTDDYMSSTNDSVDNTGEYDSMFEELKIMITPDQMQTFENLRMLFGSASYDDSNKSDENKE